MIQVSDNEKILRGLSKKVLSNYNKKKDSLNIDLNLDELMDNIIIKIVELLKNTEDADASMYEKTILNTYNKKHKWVKYELTSQFSNYLNDIKEMDITFKKPDTIIEGCSNVSEYSEKILKELNEWKKSKTQNLTDFRYLVNKKITAKKVSFSTDMEVSLLKEYISYINGKNVSSNYEMQLNSLINIPTDSTNKVKLYQGEKDGYFFEYDNDISVIKYALSLEDIKNTSIVEQMGKSIDSIFKVLNDYDILLFQFLLKNRGPDFFKDGLVSISIREACIFVFGYYSTGNRKKILASLYRMSRIRVHIKTNEENNDSSDFEEYIGSASLLGNDIMVDEDMGKKIVTVTVGNIYRNEILNGNITKIYSNVSTVFKDDADSRKIIYFLQKERITRYYNRDKEDISLGYLTQEMSYKHFGGSVLFTNKRKDRVKGRIYKSLTNIKNSNTILADVKQKGDFFKLIYTPLSDEEIKDLEERIK